MLLTPVAVAPRPGLAPAAVDVRPIEARALGTLGLDTPDASGRSFVTAASGIAAAGGAAWVASDDLPELVRIAPLGTPGQLQLALVPRPDNKYDLESIDPPSPGPSNGPASRSRLIGMQASPSSLLRGRPGASSLKAIRYRTTESWPSSRPEETLPM